MDYRYGSHTVYNIEYHFVWVTKYRYQILYPLGILATFKIRTKSTQEGMTNIKMLS